MPSRLLLVALLLATTVDAAPKKTTPPPPAKSVAPDAVPHTVAMFLAHLCDEKKLTIRASALGDRFFLEEPSGVTVYRFGNGGEYRKETFLKGKTLPQALKQYAAASR